MTGSSPRRRPRTRCAMNEWRGLSMKLPASIARFIGEEPLVRDTVGESPCQVYSFRRAGEVFFLKSSPAILASTTYSVLREARVLEWLAGRLNVPELVLVAQDRKHEFMITRRVPGAPLSERLGEPRLALELFQLALRQVQAVPEQDCPFDSGIAARLAELDYLLANGLCAAEHDLGQWPGLSTAEDLRGRLQATWPSEERLFSHGDLGDSNIFVDGRDELHFIDLGRGGLADRWLDIAFVHRDLREQIGLEIADQFVRDLAFPDQPARREYFEQLDELF